MSSVPAGWAEFNDATAVIRGRMVGATGTFSGKIASDWVDAVSNINIRGGAVSAHIGVGFPGGDGVTSCSITIPAQPHSAVADIIVPLYYLCKGVGSTMTFNIKKNGVLIHSEVRDCSPGGYEDPSNPGVTLYEWEAKSTRIRYVDFQVSPSQPQTYQISFTWVNNTEYNPVPDGKIVAAYFLGNAMVAIRKR